MTGFTYYSGGKSALTYNVKKINKIKKQLHFKKRIAEALGRGGSEDRNTRNTKETVR